MSEASRQRWLSVRNRLRELAIKVGQLDEPDDGGAQVDPSWGPVGSLLQRYIEAHEYANLMTLHRDMLAQERSIRAQEAHQPTSAPEPPDGTELPAVQLSDV